MQHFILNENLVQGGLRIFDKEIIYQMMKVLRFRKGDECILMDGKGTKAKATVEKLHPKEAVLKIFDRTTEAAPQRKLRLYCALSKKPATFELIVQKATELRVTDIIPLITERCQVQTVRKQDRLLAIIKEACEQCEQAYMPILHHEITLSDLLKNPPNGKIIAGDPWTYDAPLKGIPRSPFEDVNLIIGPEGGLTKEELEAVRKAGGTLFQLGDSILRMETAALASLAVIQYA